VLILSQFLASHSVSKWQEKLNREIEAALLVKSVLEKEARERQLSTLKQNGSSDVEIFPQRELVMTGKPKNYCTRAISEGRAKRVLRLRSPHSHGCNMLEVKRNYFGLVSIPIGFSYPL